MFLQSDNLVSLILSISATNGVLKTSFIEIVHVTLLICHSAVKEEYNRKVRQITLKGGDHYLTSDTLTWYDSFSKTGALSLIS